MQKLLVILGPTSTGKTDLALKLAKKYNGELVSCDSRQVYRGLDIGTGKMPNKFRSLRVEGGRWIVDGICIYMYDVVSPKKQYSVADYVKDASRVIEDIRKRKKLPIIVGGTGLYLRALVDGLHNLSIPVDKSLRKELEKLTKEQLQKKIKEISADRWEKLNPSDRENPRRLIRTIEIYLQSIKGRLPRRPDRIETPRNDIFKIGLTASREILYQKADKRLVIRINQSMIKEAEKLQKNGLSFKRMKQLGLEYGILADYLEGKIKSKDELIKIIQGKIHGYIRRQLTWFKKEKDVSWFNVSQEDYQLQVEKSVSGWYDSSKEYASQN